MKRRGLIKSQIVESWIECVSSDYSRQRINSERSLQASMWAQLNTRLSKNRRLFIEPKILVERSGLKRKLYPDIVVCSTREVIAIIELKYKPKGNPEFKKDIGSLDFIAKNRKSISISNSRYSGPKGEAKLYQLSNRILFVWAGVHRERTNSTVPIFSEGYPSLNGCYLQLHAATKTNQDPDVYYYES